VYNQEVSEVCVVCVYGEKRAEKESISLQYFLLFKTFEFQQLIHCKSFYKILYFILSVLH